MRKIFSIFIALILLVGSALPAFGATASTIPAAPPTLDTAITRAASYILRAVPNPTMGSVGGEWAVIGLARSRQHVSGAYFRRYFNAVERHVRERGGVLHERRITEYSRVILGLVAAGFDPRDVAGFNLMLPLGDFERTIWQGINGAIFALLALDSQNFDVPVNPDATVQATREMYVNEILRRQTPDGGWNLTAGMNGPVGANEKGDPDVTGMALQALAKYQDNPEVSAAIGRALDFLSGIQNADGGFTGNFSGGESVLESAVQVLVALTELGIPVDDPRFVKNGNTLVDNVISFQNPNGSFRHSYGSTESNLMSTEIGLYGLVAAQRAAQGRNSLYRMCDARRRDLLTP